MLSEQVDISWVIWDRESSGVNIIVYKRGDTVAVLSSLPLFTFEQQKKFYESSRKNNTSIEAFNNDIEKLVQEVRIERPVIRMERNWYAL